MTVVSVKDLEAQIRNTSESDYGEANDAFDDDVFGGEMFYQKKGNVQQIT